MQPQPERRKLRPLLRREDSVDLLIGERELSADLRLEAAEDRLDAFVVNVDDAGDFLVL